jgi:hypothetical protein
MARLVLLLTTLVLCRLRGLNTTPEIHAVGGIKRRQALHQCFASSPPGLPQLQLRLASFSCEIELNVELCRVRGLTGADGVIKMPLYRC